MNQLVESPFSGQRAAAIQESAGAMQLQSREFAETQAKYLMAQRFPRDVVSSMDRILNAFTRPTLAEKAEYQFARGGSDISGPSIRAFEAIAQQWGNMEQGFAEVSRETGADGVNFSLVEAYCLDLESRGSKRLRFIVRHWRDTKQGGYKLKDERDIYELVANQAQRRVRACIQAMIPGDVVEAAMNQAEVTLKTTADTSPEAMVKMLAAFAPWGITKDHIEKRIQRRIEAIQPAQVVTLKRIYASLRDDMSSPEDWLDTEGTTTAPAAKPESKQAPAAYPQDLFDKNLPGWLKMIADGKKTAEAIEAMVKTKGAFTPEQHAALRPAPTGQAQSPAADKPAADKPVMTFAKVADMLTRAEDVGALDDAAALISAVADTQQQTELNALYDKARAELEA